MNEAELKLILKSQKNEISESILYKKLASIEKNPENKKILEWISKDEEAHYKFWKQYTNTEVAPNYLKIQYYYIISLTLWITFALKLMEYWEEDAQRVYSTLIWTIPDVEKIIQDEKKHEQNLIWLIDEEKLKYISSIVLWVNDALVELIWVLTWLSFALQNSSFVALTWLVTWLSAALSMAGSEYLSTKTDWWDEISPLKAAFYTWTAYLFTVICLITPFFIASSMYLSIAFTYVNAVIIILFFTFYISVAKDVSFIKRFIEMLVITFWVAFLSFIIWNVLQRIIPISL